MKINSISDVQLDPTEYCFLVGSQYYSNSYFKVKIPKLIPLIDSSNPQTKRFIFNTSIFVNDKSCKPTVSNNITTQNYLTIKRSSNCNLSHLADIHGYIANNTRLTCSCLNQNAKELTIIDG